MDERRSGVDRLAGIEGADDAALGTTPPPESAPEAAHVEDEENLVPGSDFGYRLPTDAKPWATTLAAESEQAGVANDPADAQDPEFPTKDEDPR